MRPPVLILVYATTLSLVALTVVGLAWLASDHVTTTAIRSMVTADRSIVRDFVGRILTDAIAADGSLVPSGVDQAEVDRFASVHDLPILEFVGQDGSVIATAAAGRRVAGAAGDLEAALDGEARASIVEPPGDPATLVEYQPIVVGGRVLGVIRLGRDAGPILDDVAAIRYSIVAVTATATVVLAGLLMLIFRTAQRRLTAQAGLLVEATRRDPLTGLLNHGAIVEHLTNVIEHARPTDRGVGIALIDIDNFRLFNDAIGHAEGDIVLARIGAELETASAGWSAVGRFGPDEFLVVAPGDAARDLETTIARLRERIAAEPVPVDTPEELPVSVSVGIAHFPWHAQSATDLLTAATLALGEARSSGGNGIAVAGAWDDETKPGRTGFDVLHGLVLAIDTKDRYTRRHSEDVAGYAAFLVDLLDLDATIREAVLTAGLLHDVGKIGIPDDILRKPSRLTAHEMDIVKQHVKIGDLIVRQLPATALVQAGVRYHHERWDGKGYLEELAGESIPLIGRILAVADSFSAMTTTRPYRRALGVEEALKRLSDAAGSQLDERLVTVFVAAMESRADAPMPDREHGRAALWTPSGRAA